MYFSSNLCQQPNSFGEHHISRWVCGAVEYVKCSTPAQCMAVYCIRVCKTFRWNFSHAIKTFVATKMRAHVRQDAWHLIVYRVRLHHIRQSHNLCCMCRHYHVIRSMHSRCSTRCCIAPPSNWAEYSYLLSIHVKSHHECAVDLFAVLRKNMKM